MSASDIIDLIKQTFKEWSEDKASRLAAALAYYTVFSIPPLLILLISILGQVLDQEIVQEQILSQTGQLVGAQGREGIELILENAEQPGNQELIPALISLVILFFGASGVFSALQDAMNTVWDVAPRPDQGLWGTLKARFFSFTMVLGIVFLLLVSLILTTMLTALGDNISGLVTESETILQVVNFIVSLAVLVLLFALIFKVIPDVQIEWRDVWIGAMVTALLFKLGEFALGIYLENSDPASAYGAAGSLIILLLWVYYSAQILFLGAEFTQVYARRFGSDIRPDKDAVFVTEEARAAEGRPRQGTVQAPTEESDSNPRR